jgi:hypothetical protein
VAENKMPQPLPQFMPKKRITLPQQSFVALASPAISPGHCPLVMGHQHHDVDQRQVRRLIAPCTRLVAPDVVMNIPAFLRESP